MVFETSGSTGIPKQVTHSSALLRREADFFLQLLQAPVRVVRYVPPRHLYGYIFSVLLPEVARATVVDARNTHGGYHPVHFAPGDLVIAAPHQWRWLFDRDTRFPERLQGVTSTSPCPPELFGRVPLLDVYGSTETSGVGYRTAPDAPYELLPWWQPDSPALNQNDILRWVGPRNFFVEGRLDGALQISGMNVYPTLISQRLLEYPEILEARVQPMKPEEGRRLKALLVIVPGTDQQELERRIQTEFSGPEAIHVAFRLAP